MHHKRKLQTFKRNKLEHTQQNQSKTQITQFSLNLPIRQILEKETQTLITSANQFINQTKLKNYH